jgi:hypothetical protein
MSNLDTHEAEQAAITAQWETCRAHLTPCERAQAIMDETTDDSDLNARRAARVLLAIAPAYDDDTTKQGIIDAMTDLLHLCDLAGWSINEISIRARQNYSRELLDLGPAEDDALRTAIEKN